MSSINVSFAAKLATATRRWIRNTRAPAAEAQNLMADLANNAALVRAKPVFQYSANLAAIPASSATERTRWRFAFHAQPFAQYLRVQMLLALRDIYIPIKAYGQMKVTDAAGTVVGVAKVIYGGTGLGTPSNVPSEFGGAVPVTVSDVATGLSLITLTPDADYFVEFADFQYARLVSAAVWEISLLPDTTNGYATNTTGAGSPIYADQRSLIAQTARLLHRRYAAQLWNWTVDSTALTLPAADTNVVDATSTTVTTTTPGVTLDMSKRVTLRTTTQGVPVVMWAYFDSVTGSASVKLKNSAGTALLTATATAAGWVRATGYLPASSGKYDLHGLRTTAGTLRAVSLYELDYTPDSLTLYIVGLNTTPEHDTGDDFTLSVVAVGQQSNASVVLTCDRHNSETRTGIGVDTVTVAAALAAVNAGWSVAATFPTNQSVFTFTRVNLPEGTSTITFPASLHAWRYYSLSDATGDVALTGSSVSVPAATGDAAVVVPNDAVVAVAGSTVLTSGGAGAFTITASYLNGSPSGTFSIGLTLEDTLTTGPTTTTNADAWTIPAWTQSAGYWRNTITRSGLPTGDGPSSVVFATTITGADGQMARVDVTGTGGGYTATAVIANVTLSISSLAPIAALTTGGF